MLNKERLERVEIEGKLCAADGRIRAMEEKDVERREREEAMRIKVSGQGLRQTHKSEEKLRRHAPRVERGDAVKHKP